VLHIVSMVRQTCPIRKNNDELRMSSSLACYLHMKLAFVAGGRWQKMAGR